MITFEVQEQDFLYWLHSVEHNFRSMVETMKRVAEEVKGETQVLTPVRTGRLSRSFRYRVIEDNSKFQIIHIEMTALNPRTGYDYAFVQHRGWHINKNGTKVRYKRGATQLGFSTHTIYDGKVDKWSHNSNGVSGYNYGNDDFLYYGILYSENTAFEMIETDYLSLFTREFVY